MPQDWQEPVVAVIVVWAAVSLYRHLRGMLAPAKSESGVSCHGCGDCAAPDAETEASNKPSTIAPS